MEKEILISDDEYETRCAVLEEGVLNEISIERKAATQTLGNLYKGRVENVLPGMQVAFVDIGLDRHAFLHISDLKYESVNGDETEDEKSNGNRKPDKDVDTFDFKAKPAKQTRGGRGFPFLISDLISKRQELLVQVGKEPIGTKGARVTSNITLPGRYVVYMPNSSNIGVSRRIESATERDRLRNMAKTIKADVEGGFIIRTAAEGLSESEFADEIRDLINQWKQVCERAKRKSAPCLISEDLSFTNKIVRDMLTKDVKQLLIDSKPGYQEAIDYVSSVMPDLKSRVSLYQDDATTLFEAYGVERDLRKHSARKFGSSVVDILSSNRPKPWSQLMSTPDGLSGNLIQTIPSLVLTLRLLKRLSARFNCGISAGLLSLISLIWKRHRTESESLKCCRKHSERIVPGPISSTSQIWDLLR